MKAAWRIGWLSICGVMGVSTAVGLATVRRPQDMASRAAVVEAKSPATRVSEPTAAESKPAALSSPPLSYPTTGHYESQPSHAPTSSLAGATALAPLPRVSQQVISPPATHLTDNETTNHRLPPLPSAPARTPASFVATGPNLGDAAKLLESLDPATRKTLLESGLKMLEGKNGKQLEALLGGQQPEDDDAQLPEPPAPAKPAPGAVKNAPRPKSVAGPEAAPAATPATEAGEPLPPGKAQAAPESKATVTHLPGFDAGDEHLVLNIHDTDLRQVLELLSEQGGLNILASPSVQGKVSASLRDVDVNSALDAILKSTGFIARREGKLIFVGTPEEFNQMRTSLDRVGIRVYRLNYTNAKEIQNLLTPLLTPSVGKVTVTSPADVGIAVNSAAAGGDNFAANEAVLVQDYEAVLCQMDQIVREIDRKPLQVAIEAVIINVTLNDSNTLGVDFQFLRDQDTIRFATGTPRQNPLEGAGTPDGQGGSVGEFKFSPNGGLQFAFLDSTLGAFINAVETLGDVNVVAHPRLLCLNKQRAEILIGAQIGYVTTNVTQTFSTQSVSFLDVGTQLRLRPYISQDGTIRMEVHPEISDGTVNAAGIPSKNVTQVTTNVMCHDGATVVIGGLMQESMQTDTRQVPVIGGMPIIGPLFRTKAEKIVRREILVLLTPRIIYDHEANEEGQAANAEGHRIQDVVDDEATLLSRTYQSRLLVTRAQNEMARGELTRAWRTAQIAVHFNPNNHNAVALRDELEARIGRKTLRSTGDSATLPPTTLGPQLFADPAPIDGEVLPPWLFEALPGQPAPLPPPLHPRDPGIPPTIQRVQPVEPISHVKP